jgi:hypothetical protein
MSFPVEGHQPLSVSFSENETHVHFNLTASFHQELGKMSKNLQ